MGLLEGIALGELINQNNQQAPDPDGGEGCSYIVLSLLAFLTGFTFFWLIWRGAKSGKPRFFWWALGYLVSTVVTSWILIGAPVHHLRISYVHVWGWLVLGQIPALVVWGILRWIVFPIVEKAKRKREQEEQKYMAAEKKKQEAEIREKAVKIAREEYQNFIQSHGFTEPLFTAWTINLETGKILGILVADTNGKAGIISNNGSETWVGSWKNAEVVEADNNLYIKLDDQDYRDKNLKEHRVVITWLSHDKRQEWLDRINILSKKNT